jgi:hypothetical protein
MFQRVKQLCVFIIVSSLFLGDFCATVTESNGIGERVNNRVVLIIISLLFCVHAQASSKKAKPASYELTIERAWKRLDTNDRVAEHMGGALIHAGTIVLKKKIRAIAYLDDITLEWHGKGLDHLSASLYKNQPGKRFLAIEQNCMCDSFWIKDQQKLILRLMPPQLVESFNNYYLVLTVPVDLEPIIKKGFFTVVPRAGGMILSESLIKNPVKLAFAE